MVEATGGGFTLKRYLVHFRQHVKYFDFAWQEVESLASMHGVPRDQLFVNDPALVNLKINPTVYVNLPSDEVCKQIVARSVLIKEIIDVFSEVQLTKLLRERSLEKEEAGENQASEETKQAPKSQSPIQYNYESLVSNTD